MLLLSTLEEKVFFRALGKEVKKLFNSDRVTIFRSMGDGVSVLVSDTEKEEISSTPSFMEKGKGISGHVVRTSQAYYSNNSERDPLFYNAPESRGYKEELCAPIVIGGETIATIHVQNKTDENPFTDSDTIKVKEFLDSLRKPLENIGMYLAVKDLNEVLRDELDAKERELRGGDLFRVDPSHLVDPKGEGIIGISKCVREIKNLLPKIRRETPVLIEGDSGLGKESIAQEIHLKNCGSKAPFVKVNCVGLTGENFERQMFGYVQGAFLGAAIKSVGLCEQARGGTLFLDNISQLSVPVQEKLIDLLEKKSMRRVGSSLKVGLDVRVIASFSGDIKEEMLSGKFQKDLYFTLRGVSIKVLSLKDRPEDISSLVSYFLNKDRPSSDHRTVSQEALNLFKSYIWPGNVRELKSTMEMAYLSSGGQKEIGLQHLPEDIVNSNKDGVAEDDGFTEITVDELEKMHILKVLKRTAGNKTRASKVLGITIKTLYNKLHAYGAIQPRAGKKEGQGGKSL